MIVSRIIGGLGNQLFQYAFGFAVARAKSETYFLENRSFTAYPLRQYKLDRFHLDATLLPDQDSKIEATSEEGHTTGLRGFKSFYERELSGSSDLQRIPSPSFLIGYWQKAVFPALQSGELRRQFTLCESLTVENSRLESRIRESNGVAVHVRRADYVTDRRTRRIHGELNTNYYSTALEHLLERFDHLKCFVFSDDISWSRANLRFPCPVEFVGSNGSEWDHQELIMMSRCQHFIIANSSFSWWAAWLGTDPDKFVISPDPWFADPKVSAEGLIDSTWTSLKRSTKAGLLTSLRGIRR